MLIGRHSFLSHEFLSCNSMMPAIYAMLIKLWKVPWNVSSRSLMFVVHIFLIYNCSSSHSYPMKQTRSGQIAYAS